MSFTVGHSYQVREMSCHYATCSFHSQPVGSQSPSILPHVHTPIPQTCTPSPVPTENFFLPLSNLVDNLPSPSVEEDNAVEEPAQPTLSPLHALDVMAWNACSLRNKVDKHLKSVIAGVDVFGVCETLCNQVNLKWMEQYHHHGISTECVTSLVG